LSEFIVEKESELVTNFNSSFVKVTVQSTPAGRFPLVLQEGGGGCVGLSGYVKYYKGKECNGKYCKIENNKMTYQP
jgi:hypothetical protein